MDATDILKQIKEVLGNNVEIDCISPTLFDPYKIQNRVSCTIMEKSTEGVFVRFLITVDDVSIDREYKKKKICYEF